MISCFSAAFLLLSSIFSGVFGEDEPRRHYRVEDFLWSGSGDGEGSGGGSGTSWATTTIFKTTTVLRTVYPTPVMPTSSCSVSCSITPSPVITATPVPHSPAYDNVPDQKYWLVTVIRLEDSVTPPNTAVIEQRLARLYTIAFHRQQERHLGLESLNGGKRERRETVSVRVHRLSGSNGQVAKTIRLQIVYTVRLAGRAVDADVASQDMRLLADNEVATLLGFPVLTKAEPFLKSSVLPLESSNVREIWLIVGAFISTLLLIILLVLLFLLLVGKKRKKNSSPFLHTTPFDRNKSSSSVVNMGFQDDDHQPKSPIKKTAADDGSISSGNIDSIDGDNIKESPVRQPHRPFTAQKKPSSPNSYLSMPSVKAFPRGAPIPGPLEKVLDPTLSRHSSASVDPGVVGPLVWDLHCHRLNKKESEDTDVEPSVGRMRRRFHELLDDAFSLFGSRGGTPDEDEKSPAHITYGRAKSAVIMPADSLDSEKADLNRPKTTDGRPESANVGPRGAWGSTPDPSTVASVLPERGRGGGGRFKTTGAKGPSDPSLKSSLSPPSGSRAVPRPLSAGPFHRPTLEPAWIMSDSSLKPTDPAVPLIEAIKKELDKFPAAYHETGSPK